MNIKTITVLAATWLALLLIAVGLLVAASSAEACDGVYFKIGAGYKFEEDTHFTMGGERYIKDHVSPISARFALGMQKGNLHLELAHGSQWSTGFPRNNQGEPYRTEIAADWRFDLWGL